MMESSETQTVCENKEIDSVNDEMNVLEQQLRIKEQEVADLKAKIADLKAKNAVEIADNLPLLVEESPIINDRMIQPRGQKAKRQSKLVWEKIASYPYPFTIDVVIDIIERYEPEFKGERSMRARRYVDKMQKFPKTSKYARFRIVAKKKNMWIAVNSVAMFDKEKDPNFESKNTTFREKVILIARNMDIEFTVADILRTLRLKPDDEDAKDAEKNIQRILKDLLREGKIIEVSVGRYRANGNLKALLNARPPNPNGIITKRTDDKKKGDGISIDSDIPLFPSRNAYDGESYGR